MEIRRAIEELQEWGYTEQRIATAVALAGVRCSQATINRIKLGRIARPSFEVGAALLALRAEAAKGRKQAKSA